MAIWRQKRWAVQVSHNLQGRQRHLEVLDAAIRDLRVLDVERLEVSQPLEMFQPSIRNVGPVKVKHLEVVHSF